MGRSRLKPRPGGGRSGRGRFRRGSRPLSRDEGGEALQPGERDLLGVQPFEAKGDAVPEELIGAFDRVGEALHLWAICLRAIAGQLVGWHLARQPGTDGPGAPIVATGLVVRRRWRAASARSAARAAAQASASCRQRRGRARRVMAGWAWTRKRHVPMVSALLAFAANDADTRQLIQDFLR